MAVSKKPTPTFYDNLKRGMQSLPLVGGIFGAAKSTRAAARHTLSASAPNKQLEKALEREGRLALQQWVAEEKMSHPPLPAKKAQANTADEADEMVEDPDERVATGLDAFYLALDENDSAERSLIEILEPFTILRETKKPERRKLAKELGLDVDDLEEGLADLFNVSKDKIREWVGDKNRSLDEIVFTELLNYRENATKDEINQRIALLTKMMVKHQKWRDYHRNMKERFTFIFEILRDNPEKTLDELKAENPFFKDAFPEPDEMPQGKFFEKPAPVTAAAPVLGPLETPQAKEALEFLHDLRAIIISQNNPIPGVVALVEKFARYDTANNLTLTVAFTSHPATPMATLIKNTYGLKDDQEVANKIMEIYSALQ